MKNRYQPDKSLDILDEVCAYVSLMENSKLKKYNSLTISLLASNVSELFLLIYLNKAGRLVLI